MSVRLDSRQALSWTDVLPQIGASAWRRQFLCIVGGAAGAWPLLARAQQPTKLPIIGFLGTSTPAAWSTWIAAFVQRLRELGWIVDSTVAIDVRWAEGKSERFAEIAAEFVRLNVDVIVTSGAATPAAKADDIGHTDRFHAGERPGRHGASCGSLPVGRRRGCWPVK